MKRSKRRLSKCKCDERERKRISLTTKKARDKGKRNMHKGKYGEEIGEQEDERRKKTKCAKWEDIGEEIEELQCEERGEKQTSRERARIWGEKKKRTVKRGRNVRTRLRR